MSTIATMIAKPMLAGLQCHSSYSMRQYRTIVVVVSALPGLGCAARMER